MTMGNFTDAFQRTDLSKMSIGFLQEIGSVSKQVLLKHLVHRTLHCKTSAIKAINNFGLFLENDFWDVCFASLKEYAVSGVRMYILGKGICTIYPVLAYCVGDDPALHRYTGVFEGNAHHTCISCKYSVRKHGMFRPDLQEWRDPLLIYENAIIAISGQNNKNTGVPILQVERVAMKFMKSQSLHCLPNATFGVPMGEFAVG